MPRRFQFVNYLPAKGTDDPMSEPPSLPLPNRDEHPEMSDSQWDLMKLIMSEEPLHPDLEPWVEDTGHFGKALRHPWVYEVFGLRPGLANKKYEYKKRAVAEAIAKNDWHTYVFLHERPYRADALIKVRDTFGEHITDEAFWSLVGSVWVDSENIWQNYAEWDDLLNTERPGREHMMDEEERKIFSELPDTLTIYRGSIPDLNEGGLSWTLNRNVAKFFAKRFNSVHGKGGVIDTAEVPKSLVVACFAGRGEEEIVVEHGEAVLIVSREVVAGDE